MRSRPNEKDELALLQAAEHGDLRNVLTLALRGVNIKEQNNDITTWTKSTDTNDINTPASRKIPVTSLNEFRRKLIVVNIGLVYRKNNRYIAPSLLVHPISLSLQNTDVR